MSFSLQPECIFRVPLASGRYVVRLTSGKGLGSSKDLPKAVEIRPGQTMRLDVRIDTGIR